ncbi:hypothetical protein N825_23045 [Skermanella stibiiresistens SB22]|uniref:Uncharacterized protein n=1 Tax=Skermanella stibiiresistens SB22 TaxID=1385369 RepID=W9GZI2_9PROT|nr:hypothetical protein N825_23045 [Skermanella stibiiresistens SB22]
MAGAIRANAPTATTQPFLKPQRPSRRTTPLPVPKVPAPKVLAKALIETITRAAAV